MSIKKLANEALNLMETGERVNGDTYVKFKSDAPMWTTDLARAAHNYGKMMPDDFRYEFIESALTAIANHDDIDDARDSLEADVYTSELTRWLHSRNDRTCYVDDAIKEFGKANNLDADLAMGQLLERQEVFHQVWDYLNELNEDEEATG